MKDILLGTERARAEAILVQLRRREGLVKTATLGWPLATALILLSLAGFLVTAAWALSWLPRQAAVLGSIALAFLVGHLLLSASHHNRRMNALCDLLDVGGKLGELVPAAAEVRSDGDGGPDDRGADERAAAEAGADRGGATDGRQTGPAPSARARGNGRVHRDRDA